MASHAFEHLPQCYFSARSFYVIRNMKLAELFSRAFNQTSEIVSARPRGAPGSAR
jgi:hypothetical protein